MSGIYIVSVRHGDRDQLRAAAYDHVGLAVDGIDQERITVATAFTDAGFTTADLIAYIEGIHAVATNPESLGIERFDLEQRGGSDSESRPTNLFMFSLGGKDETHDWLACAETAHEVWPRLLDTLGASVGGTVFDEDGTHRQISLDKFRVPKALRLKSGWDYDAEGNQVWLPIEEAWRRFLAHNESRTDRDGEEYMDAKTLRKMRRHMEGFYGGYPTTREKQEANA